MSIEIQWALAGLVVLGYVSIWRMDSAQRAVRLRGGRNEALG
jgi:hypothetical protein